MNAFRDPYLQRRATPLGDVGLSFETGGRAKAKVSPFLKRIGATGDFKIATNYVSELQQLCVMSKGFLALSSNSARDYPD
jgi:hypothetical protein